MITIARNVAHTQSYGCWLCLHYRYTAIYFKNPLRRWFKNWQGIRLELMAGDRKRNRLAFA